MTIDHLSVGAHDIATIRTFYAEKLGFPVLIHERMLICDYLQQWIATQVRGNS